MGSVDVHFSRSAPKRSTHANASSIPSACRRGTQSFSQWEKRRKEEKLTRHGRNRVQAAVVCVVSCRVVCYETFATARTAAL
jgi:hypothetical protein